VEFAAWDADVLSKMSVRLSNISSFTPPPPAKNIGSICSTRGTNGNFAGINFVADAFPICAMRTAFFPRNVEEF